MLELIDGLPGNIVGIAASGRVTMRDCQDVLLPAIKKSRKRHDKIRLYYELNSRFPGAAWDDLDLGLEHASRPSLWRFGRMLYLPICSLVPGGTGISAAVRLQFRAAPGSAPHSSACSPVID
jgi:SpoIIAA-like